MDISTNQEPHRRSYERLRPLVAAGAAAAVSVHATTTGGGVEAADVEQAVWLGLLEGAVTPAGVRTWAERFARAEADSAVRRSAAERRYADPPAPGTRPVEEAVLAAERRREMRAAVRRLPDPCARVVGAMLSRSDPTYPEISRELGISQGSLGPLRSRCLGCLRSIFGRS